MPLLAEIKAKYSLERLKKQIDGDALAVYSNWCEQRKWTDLFVNEGRFWAFPPGAVLPLLVTEMEEQGSSKSSQPRTGRVYFEEDVPFKSSLLGNKQAETGVGSCRYWQI